ncbi:MAG: PDZ domain-containing protein [Gemmataceae bacterium]
MSLRVLLGLVATLVVTASASAQVDPNGGEARLLRFPTVHGKHLVFCYAGDLYTVDSSGGVARRLTSHDGYEMFPRFSPDGKQVAFTGQYDGNTEIYVIPAEGGEPKRLTYTTTLGRDDISDRMGPNNICMGWTPDGRYIVFRSRMDSFNDFLGKLYRVPATGGIAEELPLPRGGFCSFSPDGKKLAYNRVFREFRTWKRYRGGMADDIWVHDFDTRQTVKITDDPAQDIIPMWYRDRVYFTSERTGRLNLFVVPATGGKARQLTNYTDYDIKFPSLGDTAIVFERAGYIHKFDLESEKVTQVPIRILEDRVLARKKLHNVAGEVTNFEISPDGAKALFGARGDVFTVPAKPGATRNLTQTPGVHERNSKWSPDGKWIAYISDATGEDEVWVRKPDGTEPRQLTTGADTYKYEVVWSPDSKKILWGDKKNRVSVVEVESKKVVIAAQSKMWEIRDAVWSPDSKWIAFSQEEPDEMQQVYLHSVETGKTTRVTEGRYSASEPCFSGDGKYLFFVSARDFNPIYSRTEWNHAYRDMDRIYLVTLAKDTPSPFLPKDESEKPEEKKPAPEKPGPEKDKKEEFPTKLTDEMLRWLQARGVADGAMTKELYQQFVKETANKPKNLKVDLDGLDERVLRLPVPAGNYRNLQSVGNSVYYVRAGSGSPPSLAVFDLGAKKETVLGPINGYEISADGKKMIYSQQGKHYIIDLPKGPIAPGSPLDTSGMEVELDRRAEWKQIFHECWRQMRDFFYDPTMHGIDWVAMRERYEPLLPHVAHRADLTYIIGEMISELNAGHAYVGGGDVPQPRRVPLGKLGATLRKDPVSGYFQIVKILKGARWDPDLRSPLNELGINAKDGDFILSVDGKSTKGMVNIAESLVNKVGKQVTLELANQPKEGASRKVVVVPIASEAQLHYHDWVEGNLKRVSDATGGQVGYLHVPDMLQTGLNQFAKYFYPQVRKRALIIDMRGNGGGNVSPMLIERLRREIAMITVARNSSPRPDPVAMVYGPMVCLMNEFSASDGDLFPYRFRQHKLGKLIGKRSWGGVVGIRGTLPLLDGGTLNRPEFSRYDTAGKEWVIEGYGVDPDIVVDNDPAREYGGEDQQLERGIAEVLRDLKAGEAKGLWKIPPPPASPKK